MKHDTKLVVLTYTLAIAIALGALILDLLVWRPG